MKQKNTETVLNLLTALQNTNRALNDLPDANAVVVLYADVNPHEDYWLWPMAYQSTKLCSDEIKNKADLLIKQATASALQMYRDDYKQQLKQLGVEVEDAD